MWPSGQATTPPDLKTREEKTDNRIIAKQMFLNNIPGK